MSTKDPRVDAYIASAADFARPILKHLRKVVHDSCPEVEETMKWSFPHFVHKGILCSMAAFKQHCSFGFWKHALVVGNCEGPGKTGRDAMGQFGRIASLNDLPDARILQSYVREAVRLNKAGVKNPARLRSRSTRPLVVPADLKTALGKNKKALAAFEGFSPSHRREYVDWITEAKREETRLRRLKTAIEWLAEGKPHNWKYR